MFDALAQLTWSNAPIQSFDTVQLGFRHSLSALHVQHNQLLRA